jgi:16S rRNA processing protein RimM
LGTLLKPHGIKGSVLLGLAGLGTEDIKIKGPVFVEIDGLLVPFFIESLVEKSAGLVIIRFEGIQSESQARDFAGCQVFIGNDRIRRRTLKLQDGQGILDYRVIDKQLGYIGLAVDIMELKNNPLLKVKSDEKEYLVPVHENIILSVNDKERTITIDAPAGLFEI